jgi:hypothetical protein
VVRKEEEEEEEEKEDVVAAASCYCIAPNTAGHKQSLRIYMVCVVRIRRRRRESQKQKMVLATTTTTMASSGPNLALMPSVSVICYSPEDRLSVRHAVNQ